ncbi:hypothetical protein NLI96_g4189 [Meripilus lineatus]|uniref:Uncharacterized protein n=1 Tax=Meripilus lineatus TaxID=2056292 RepID=A0AAD5YFX7_9APHY|nr:hypothetical protein NLI96_g4189 [Physisporinus lineatus]
MEDDQDTFYGSISPVPPQYQFETTPTDIIDLCASFIQMKVGDEEQGSRTMMENLCCSAPGHDANTKDDDLTSLFEDTEFDEDTLGGISEALTSSDTDTEVRRVQVKRRLSLSEPEYNADSESSHDYFRIADASTGSASEDEDEDEHLSWDDTVGFDTASLGAELERDRLEPSSAFRNFSNTLTSNSLHRPHLASSSAPLLPGPTFPIASLVGIRSHHYAQQCRLSLLLPNAQTISSPSSSFTSTGLDID